jgi:glycosyltransferase involved in cell wall biosynthesis
MLGAPLARLYASADIFCFPSTTDTFGQVILEAAASGLPTVAVAAGGATELVLHERTGLLVPADDSQAFAAALSRLIEDADLRKRLAVGAAVEASSRTWDRSLAELRNAYLAAIRESPADFPIRAAA